MMRQQLFVKRRCDLGEEDRIVGVLIELGVLRKPGMHRMARFVRERVDIREDVALIIHQDVRRRAVAAAGEGTAAFPFRLVTIAPTPTQTFA
jgi:hypothetical protein